MTVSFEQFPVYVKTVDFTVDIFQLLDAESFNKEFALADQLKRATISISNNIAEGSEYNNNRQFIRFLWMAKGSSAEVRSMLYLLLMLGKIDEKDFKNLSERCLEIGKELYHFIKYLERNSAGSK
ncbi:four helix bundle protein [Cruoricaptor ignavus]|uniref:Four helix bundle protein n=1 Tax=Cruoricaptor ignavus TaxID=1118202 RepID=A0A7M1T1U4_9FLAO|nr:four helix bundle protein [Cruoricaptor ignavus]QOR73227.1 four helix bundle protein [Cruoricaptor ignavus]